MDILLHTDREEPLPLAINDKSTMQARTKVVKVTKIVTPGNIYFCFFCFFLLHVLLQMYLCMYERLSHSLVQRKK